MSRLGLSSLIFQAGKLGFLTLSLSLSLSRTHEIDIFLRKIRCLGSDETKNPFLLGKVVDQRSKKFVVRFLEWDGKMAPTVTDLPPLRPLSSTPEITWNLDLARWNLSFLLLRKISKNSSV